MFRLTAENLHKRFGPRKVFANISFELKTGESIAVVGPNGSGKSTLLMVLLSHYRPSKGEVTYWQDDQKLDDSAVRSSSALVSPYLQLYDSLTAEENLQFFATVSNVPLTGKEINKLLSRVGLEGRGADLVGAYSSGMKQRLKYAAAIMTKPAFLFLDEPSSNLDEAGKNMVREVIDEARATSIIVIATNEQEEQALAGKLCRVID